MNPCFLTANSFLVTGLIHGVLLSAGELALPFSTHPTNNIWGCAWAITDPPVNTQQSQQGKKYFDSFAKVQTAVYVIIICLEKNINSVQLEDTYYSS